MRDEDKKRIRRIKYRNRKSQIGELRWLSSEALAGGRDCGKRERGSDGSTKARGQADRRTTARQDVDTETNNEDKREKMRKKHEKQKDKRRQQSYDCVVGNAKGQMKCGEEEVKDEETHNVNNM